MHKDCWISWTKQSGGPTCIICRKSRQGPLAELEVEEEPLPAPIPLPLHVILTQREIVYPMVIAFILMVYLLFLTQQSGSLPYKPRGQLHDEL